MGFLSTIGKKSKNTMPNLKGELAQKTGEASPDVRERRSVQICEIENLRQDLSKMSTALRESVRLSEGAYGEIEKLNGFMKTAELNTLSLERLQPENVRLKSKLENLQGELAKKTTWASELESRSAAYKARFDETQLTLEANSLRLREQDESVAEHVTWRSEMNAELDGLQSERRALLVNVEELRSVQNILQEDTAALKQSKLVLGRQNTELEKQVDLLDARVERERTGRENVVSELKTIRLDYAQEKSEHIETLSKFDKAVYATTASQNALSDMQQRSDDKIFALNASIEGFKAQLKVNSEMSTYDALEKTKLKTLAERDARRAEDMALRLDRKTIELAENQTALAGVKANYDALNDKFLSLLAEMEYLQGDHTKQSKKLDEYSSITGIAVGQSFYENRTGVPNLKLVRDPS